MAKVFIFRHGQTTDNIDHDFSGIRDVDLTPQGVEEAEKIGEELKNEPVTKAYQSNQIRSKHTLELVLNGWHKNVQIITDPRIRERDYGDLTGLNKDEIAKIDPKDFALWHRSYDVAPPGGESIEMVGERVIPFIEDLKKDLKPIDVVFISASANSIRPMRKYFEKLTEDQTVGYEYSPAQIFKYEI